MKFVTYNIQYGKGKDGQHDLDRIVAELQGADCIALQEVECYWSRSGLMHQPEHFAWKMPDYYWVYGAGVDLSMEATDVKDIDRGLRRQFGNMVLSRYPIIYSRNHLLPKYGSIGPPSIQRNALECAIRTESGDFRLYSVHLTHLSAVTRLPQVDRLLQIHRDASHEGLPINGEMLGEDWTKDGLPDDVPGPALLMGDFNMEFDSEEYQAIVGPVSDYGGRVSNPAGFIDTWAEAGHDLEQGVTADVGGRPGKLDYVFVSSSWRSRIKNSYIDGKAQGSDHQPLWVEID